MSIRLTVQILAISLVSFGQLAQAEPQNRNKLLLIGIDGTRPDALAAASTPNFDRLRQTGAYSDNAITGDISFSGPGWASMLTGVWCDKHKVLSNEFLNPDFEAFPSVFDRIQSEQPQLKTVSIAHWDKINAEIIGYADYQVTTETDQEVADLAVEQLQTGDPDLVFLHFDDVDHAGHDCCYSPSDTDYIKAIETVDRQIGQVLDALDKRKGENWLVLSSTDHGGGGVIPDQHGPNVEVDRRIFILAAEQRSGRDDGHTLLEGQRPQITDVAATMLKWLGIPLREEWQLDGQPLPLRQGDTYEAGRSIPECAIPREIWDTGKPLYPLPGDKQHWEQNPI